VHKVRLIKQHGINDSLTKHFNCDRPTFVSFKDYTTESLLHCGITDSKGRVFNFEYNVYIDETWPYCINIDLSKDSNVSAMSDDEWDKAMMDHYRNIKKFVVNSH